MKRRPQSDDRQSIPFSGSLLENPVKTGLVLSGGGSRAAYQVGALRALLPFFSRKEQSFSIVIGSSIGAINGLVTSSCLKHGLDETVQQLESMWLERNFRNTFSGTPSQAFFRAIRMAVMQYLSPGPNPTSSAIFDPTPLMNRVDGVIDAHGGLTPEARAPSLEAVGVMTTIEGAERKPLLFLSSHKTYGPDVLEGASFEVCYVSSLSAKHGFASAALPSVLPPVELDTEAGKVRLVDGGISQNIPVDPAVRLGADRVLVIDVSGRDWWLNHYGEAHDTRPSWEVPAALKTFCMRPPETFVSRCKKPIGPLLKEAVGSSRGKFMAAVGPVWPVFSLLKKKLGEELAYEAMTYVALDPDYIQALIERGYDETRALLKDRSNVEFKRTEDYDQWVQAL